jgi:predicted nucleic acid-binding protein
MRVLVDTSVWVDFFNGHPSTQAETLARLISEDADLLTCGLVVSEVLQPFAVLQLLFSVAPRPAGIAF